MGAWAGNAIEKAKINNDNGIPISRLELKIELSHMAVNSKQEHF